MKWAEQSRKALEMPKRAADLIPYNGLISVPVNPYLFFFFEVANSVNPPNQPYCDKLVTLKQTTGQETALLSNNSFSETGLWNSLE